MAMTALCALVRIKINVFNNQVRLSNVHLNGVERAKERKRERERERRIRSDYTNND